MIQQDTIKRWSPILRLAAYLIGRTEGPGPVTWDTWACLGLLALVVLGNIGMAIAAAVGWTDSGTVLDFAWEADAAGALILIIGAAGNRLRLRISEKDVTIDPAGPAADQPDEDA